MLGAHDIIRSTVGFPSDDSDLGDGGLSVGKQKLGSVTDDTVVLLVRTCGTLHHHYVIR